MDQNLCEDANVTAKVITENKSLVIEAVIQKDCWNALPGCNKNRITTSIDASNEILCEGIPIKGIIELSPNISKRTREQFRFGKKQYQTYELFWHKKTDPVLVQKVLFQILKGATAYQSKHSLFKTIIVLRPEAYRLPPPPPPLPENYLE